MQNTSIPEDWEHYMSEFDGMPGSITVNLALKDKNIQERYPIQVSFNLPISPCRPDGLSDGDALDKAAIEEDRILSDLQMPGRKMVSVGTFTYNCERRLYYYFENANQLEEQLQALLSAYPAETTDLTVLEDKQWDAYSDFLYPNDYHYQQIMNNRVMAQLLDAGDNPDLPRILEHFLYFKTEADRTSAADEAVANHYRLFAQEFIDQEYPYSLGVAFQAPLHDVHSQSYYLMDLARKYNGDYDGWGCTVTNE